MQDFYFDDSKLYSKLEQMVSKKAECNNDQDQSNAKLW